jgi:prevent-host-death family protein
MVRPSPTISAFDAKNGLGGLLDRVEAGEEVVITRHGKPIAKLVPISKRDTAQIDVALATFKQVRDDLTARGVKISRDEIRQWINQGRR